MVFIGDTVYVEVTIAATKPMARLGGGLVVFDARVLNQNGDVVHKGEWQMLIKSKD